MRISSIALAGTLCALFVACTDTPVQEGVNDEADFFEILESAPEEIVSRGDFPGWLDAKIDLHADKHDATVNVKIFKGKWKGKVVYFIYDWLSSCLLCDVYWENGEKIRMGMGNDFCETSGNWVLIWEFVGLDEVQTRSEFVDDGKLIEDEFDFPVKQGSLEWMQFKTVQSRIDALQIPEDVLSTISTAGLLETCLKFPYLTDILFYDDYQHGFESLCAEFNGFGELIKRSDLTNALLTKYSRMGQEAASVRSRSDVEIGRFSIRHFVLEMIISQDVVIETIGTEQEKYLIAMSIERTKMEHANPDIFGGLNTISTSLLYAKKMVSISHKNVGGKEVLTDFIQAPRNMDQETIQYLENYFVSNYGVN